MAKLKTRYLCQACGSEQHRWQGQCPDCAEWNTLVQEASGATVFSAKHDLSSGGRAVELVGLNAVVALPDRMRTGIEEFDRAVGGGIVPGSAMLLGGDPVSASRRCCSRWRPNWPIPGAASFMSQVRKPPIR